MQRVKFQVNSQILKGKNKGKPRKESQMSFAQKFVQSFFQKDDPVRKQLKKIDLYTDILTPTVIFKGIEIFHRYQQQSQQEQMIKAIMKLMQQKTTYARKLKLLFYIIQITKETKYDIADILINKKLKIFTKSNIKVKLLPILDKNSIQQYIYIELIMPLYNYLMKLSVNEELFNTCKSGQIPNDEIFRRGMKIRFIWIFKIYNLIHILIPILETLLKFIKTFPGLWFFAQMATYLMSDIIVMNDFVIKAIEEASSDNYILMPYFDMLQFYESLTQQRKTSEKIMAIYELLKKSVKNLQKPQELKLTPQQIQEIQVQALRVKLISNTLKNPKKDHTRLQTQYNVKSEKRQKFQSSKKNLTQGDRDQQEKEEAQNWKEKFRNLDNKPQMNLSMEEVSGEDQEDEQEEQQNR